MILIVTGSRQIDDPAVFRRALKQSGWAGEFKVCGNDCRISEVWHGGCRGVDQLAKQWAEQHDGIGRIHEFAADNFDSPTERNERMIRATEVRNNGVAGVLAIPGPESSGTWDCVRKARGAGLDVHVYEVEKEERQVSLLEVS